MITRLDQILADAERRQAARQAEYKLLANLTGQTVAQVEADLTAPDPDPRERLFSDLRESGCPDCDNDVEIAFGVPWPGVTVATVTCPKCGIVGEYDVEPANESAIYY